MEQFDNTLFLFKNKLYENNEAEIVSKNKNKLRTFWGWEVQKQKLKWRLSTFLLNAWLQKNDLHTVKHIFCDVIQRFIGV